MIRNSIEVAYTIAFYISISEAQRFIWKSQSKCCGTQKNPQ